MYVITVLGMLSGIISTIFSTNSGLINNNTDIIAWLKIIWYKIGCVRGSKSVRSLVRGRCLRTRVAPTPRPRWGRSWWGARLALACGPCTGRPAASSWRPARPAAAQVGLGAPAARSEPPSTPPPAHVAAASANGRRASRRRRRARTAAEAGCVRGWTSRTRDAADPVRPPSAQSAPRRTRGSAGAAACWRPSCWRPPRRAAGLRALARTPAASSDTVAAWCAAAAAVVRTTCASRPSLDPEEQKHKIR